MTLRYLKPLGLALPVLGGILWLGVLWQGAAQPATPIRVGILYSLSGPQAASAAPLADAVQLALEEINANGGLLGRPLQVVAADDHSDPAAAAEAAQRLIQQEQASVLFACADSPCRLAVKPVVERQRHLLVYAPPYAGLEQSPHIFYTGALPNQQVIPGARWAMEQFGKRVYLLGNEETYAHTAHRLIRDLLAGADGTVLAERYLPREGGAFDAVAEEIRRLRPDVIFNSLGSAGNAAFFRALHHYALERIPVFSFAIGENELASLGVDLVHPAHYAAWSYFQSLPGEANRRFLAAFRARFGASRVISESMESAYNGVRLWAAAVRAAGSAQPEAANAALGRQSVPGPSGIVAVDAASRHLWRWMRIGQAGSDGQFDIVHSFDWPLRPTPYPEYRAPGDWQTLAQEAQP